MGFIITCNKPFYICKSTNAPMDTMDRMSCFICQGHQTNNCMLQRVKYNIVELNEF